MPFTYLPWVEHQAPFARHAQQVHAGVAQLSGVYAAKLVE